MLYLIFGHDLNGKRLNGDFLNVILLKFALDGGMITIANYLI